MRIIKTKSYEEMSKKAANIIASVVTLKPDCMLGLATGSSPIGTYDELVKKYEAGDLHWLHKAISNPKTFRLGTYHGRCTKLQAYLDEFCFRFNRHMTRDQIFLRLTRAVATSRGMLS